MKQHQPLLLVITLAFLLAGCNLPANSTTQGNELNVTQAYQTVEARLTQAVAQSPIASETSPATETEAPLIAETSTVAFTPTFTLIPSETATPQPAPACDRAAAAYPKIDITIDDDTEMAPGQSFTKIWRVVNVGTCTWTTSYAAVFFSGEQMNAPDSIPLEQSVAPNQSIDISVDMVAPEEPGTYQSNWKLRNANGELFGIGPNGESPFWVRIVVVEVDTPTPTATPTTTTTPSVQANGNVTMVISDTLDLDTGALNSGDADLLLESNADEPPTYLLSTQGGTLLSLYGTNQPSLADCQNASLDLNQLDLTLTNPGTYYCYRTSLDLPGWLRVDFLDANSQQLTLSFWTWFIP